MRDLSPQIRKIKIKNGASVVDVDRSGKSVIAVMNKGKLSKIFVVDKTGKKIPTVTRPIKNRQVARTNLSGLFPPHYEGKYPKNPCKSCQTCEYNDDTKKYDKNCKTHCCPEKEDKQ